MAKTIEKRDSYRLGTSVGDVKVSVAVGVGQEGMAKVTLGTTALITTSPPIGRLNLGPAPGLEGLLLLIETLVTDVSTKADKMLVDVTLEGGVRTRTITSDAAVNAPGESLLFRTFVVFRK